MINQDKWVSKQSSQPEGVVPEARSRGIIYELLASCFLLEPIQERLNQVMNILVQLEIDSNSFIEKMFDRPEEITELYYDRLFVPFSQKYVPPIESAIRGKDPLNPKKTFGNISIAESQSVGLCYEAAEFSPFQLQMFEPLQGVQFMDHMGFELAFMSYLCYAEEQSAQEKNEEKVKCWQRLQKQFLNEHLAQWSGRYAELMEERGQDFYSGIARYVAAWVEIDAGMFCTLNYH